MAYNYVTVTGTYQDDAGNPATGQAEFYVSAPVVDATAKVTITPLVDRVTLDATGAFSVRLLAQDNATLSAGWNWVFRPAIQGIPPDAQTLYVKYANGATQDITSSTLAG